MENISTIEQVIFIIAGLIAAFLSSVSGGGGGFITTPLLIILGLTPAQAISTGKISGLAIAVGSISGLKRGGVKYSKKQAIIISLMALLIGLAVPLVITKLDSLIYQKLMGVLLLVMIPVVVRNKFGEKTFMPTTKQKGLGYFLVGAVLFLQGVTSTGIGLFINIIMMRFLGLSILVANIVKRYSQLILNIVIVAAIISTGLIVWPLALISVVVNLIGGHLGGHYATKISTKSARYFFVSVMFISGIALLIT